MGWRVTDFRLDNCGSSASTFQFEVAIPADQQDAAHLLRGDGLLLQGGRVRINREDEMRKLANRAGIDGERFIEGLQHFVIHAANEPSLQTA